MTVFVPKPFAEIVADEVEQVRTTTDLLTDFNVGSVTRSILEAQAVALDDYYQEVYLGLLRAIPTAVYTGFGFDLLPAVAAAGTVEISRTSGNLQEELVVPLGTRLVSTTGQYYVTNEEVTIPVDVETATVTATAEVVGAAGNADPGAITSSDPLILATNPALFAGGADAETEEQRAERFIAYIRSLSRGTLAALTYGASLPALYHPVTGVLSERVQRAAVNETPGHVELYIHNGSYGASDALIEAVQKLIDGYLDQDSQEWVGGYRPAGMRVDVLAMTDVPLDVTVELTVSGDQSVIEADVTGRLSSWLHDAVAGQAIRPIDLINVMLAADGVDAATILSPAATQVVAPHAVISLGELSITWLG